MNNEQKLRGAGMSNNNLVLSPGLVPPQDIEIEKAVLGALLLEKSAVNETIDILKAETFYDPKHQLIFKAIRELFITNNPIDILTVVTYLKKTGELESAGGIVYLSSLTSQVASSANIQTYARIITEKAIKRELINVGSKLVRDSYDEKVDVFDLLNAAEQNLFQVSENNMSKQVLRMSSAIVEALKEIENATLNKTGVSGVPSGFRDLDRVTAGWQKSDMIVIAARPGMGKTAFVLSMARNMCVDFNIPVAVFSLEMSAVQLVKRLIASESMIDADKLRRGNLSHDEYNSLHSKITKLTTAPLYIDDTPGLNILDLRAKCRRLKHENKIEVVIIDYLQLMSAGEHKGNREQEISTISRSIKEIAKELNVPILALSQLSRSVETRGGVKKPMLSDLRESGAIEQDADIVSFIYRPEYYGLTEDENGNSTQNMGEIIIAKHRNGSLENVKLKFIGEFAKFENMNTYSDSFNNLPIKPKSFELQQSQPIEQYSNGLLVQKKDTESKRSALDNFNNTFSSPPSFKPISLNVDEFDNNGLEDTPF